LQFTNVDRFNKHLLTKCRVDLQQARQLAAASAVQTGDDTKATTSNGAEGQVIETRILMFTRVQTAYSPPPEFIIVDCSTLNYIDYMGVCTLARMHADLHDVHVNMLFAQVQRKCTGTSAPRQCVCSECARQTRRVDILRSHRP